MRLRKITATLNGLVVVVSLGLFAYTFFAVGHLTEHARAFVTEKTLEYSKPIIEFAEQGLESPLSARLLSEAQKATIEKEVEQYRSDPSEYVLALTSDVTGPLGDNKEGKIKEKIREYYQSILSRLVTDLRIFSGSNVVGGLFALGLLMGNGSDRKGTVTAFSFVVFAAVAYSSYLYIDGMSFFRILFKWHLGWWYPAGIVITILGLFLHHGLHKKDAEESLDPKA